MKFHDLSLDERIVRAIDSCGFETATPIQAEAIPPVLDGRDVAASAQTGTGKTAAFVLPLLHRLLARPSEAPQGARGPRVLILTPTRELALQVDAEIHRFGKHCPLTGGNVIGGAPYPPQLRMLRAPLDLMVATPGRLIDHMSQGKVDFSRLETLVLDEADRMLDMGFIDAVRQIAKETPAQRQTLLFSATLEGKVMALARELLNDPVQIKLAANNRRHESIAQRIHRADDERHKRLMLERVLGCETVNRAVVFTATKQRADELAEFLADIGHRTESLHGDKPQGKRKRIVERVKLGNLRVLVATDVAARGLDIDGISHVVNYDMPMVAEDYIHRIGRTGRAGATGTAVSFVGPKDFDSLRSIERLIGSALDREEIPGLEPRTPEPRFGGAGQRKGGGAGKKGGRKPYQSWRTKRGSGGGGRFGASHEGGGSGEGDRRGGGSGYGDERRGGYRGKQGGDADRFGGREEGGRSSGPRRFSPGNRQGKKSQGGNTGRRKWAS